MRKLPDKSEVNLTLGMNFSICWKVTPTEQVSSLRQAHIDKLASAVLSATQCIAVQRMNTKKQQALVNKSWLNTIF